MKKGTTTITQYNFISELEGIGKTQTAIEYAHRYKHEYKSIFFIDASTKETIEFSYTEIASKLQFSENSLINPSFIVAKIKQLYSTERGWLLIFDNVNGDDYIKDYLPDCKIQVLLTTCIAISNSLTQSVLLNKLSIKDGALLLLKKANLITNETCYENVSTTYCSAAETISKELDGLPLAIEYAGTYIKETHIDLINYLEIYHKSMSKILGNNSGPIKEAQEPTNTVIKYFEKYRKSMKDLLTGHNKEVPIKSWVSKYHKSLIITINLVFEKLLQRNQLAAIIIQLCGFLAPVEIPEEIFIEGGDCLGLTTYLGENKEALENALNEAYQFSLIKRNAKNNTIEIQRIVQQIIKELVGESQQKDWIEKLIKTLNHVFPLVEYQNLLKCKKLIAHSKIVTNFANELKIVTIETARLLNQSAVYLTIHTQYIEEAEPIFIQALKIIEKALGERHCIIANLYHNLGVLYKKQNKYDQAEVSYKRALEIRIKLLGDDHFEISQSFESLAELYREQNSYEQAEEMYIKGLEVYKKISNVDGYNPDTYIILNNLAALYTLQGKYEQAEDTFKQAEIIINQIFEAQYPEIIIIIDNLAMLYTLQGKYKQAEDTFKQALKIKEQILGKDHSDLTVTLDNLARLFESQGRYEESEKCYRQTLSLLERDSINDQSELFIVMKNYATMLEKANRQQEASQQREYIIERLKDDYSSNVEKVYTSHSNNKLFYSDKKTFLNNIEWKAVNSKTISITADKFEPLTNNTNYYGKFSFIDDINILLLTSLTKINNHSWDFFLTHQDIDNTVIDIIYKNLSQQYHVCLDNSYFQPKFQRRQELAKAQQNALITVIIITAETPESFFQRPDIINAKEMASNPRTKNRIAPIFVNITSANNKTIPNVLYLKHSEYISSNIEDCNEICSKLAHSHKTLRILARYTSLKQNDNIITQLFKSAFQSFEDSFNWVKDYKLKFSFLENAGVNYATQVENRYSFVQIMGMNKPAPLRTMYTRVNFLEKLTTANRTSIEDMEKDFDRDTRGFGKIIATEEGINVVNKLNKIIVLGKPGAGKTTFLKYIALQSLDNKLHEQLIPIFIGLKDWTESRLSLFEYIVKEFACCNFPDATTFLNSLLQDGKCILLFDGLDEVTTTIEHVITSIKQFESKYNSNKFIISCRIAAFNYKFERFWEVEVADFTDTQIFTFINNWFEKDQQIVQSCWSSLEDNKPIKELSSIPLLLTLLCLAFSENLKFPSNKADLYKDAIDALLKKWDISRRIVREEVYKKLSLKLKELMFSQIAALTFESNQYFIHQKELERHISDFIKHLPETNDESLYLDSEAILKSIEAQHGIFIERAKNIYSFSHLTVQEYFTAKYITDNTDNGTMKALVEYYITNDQWREVFVICSGMVSKADNLLLAIMKKINLMADDKLKHLLANLNILTSNLFKRNELSTTLTIFRIMIFMHLFDISLNIKLEQTLKLSINNICSLDSARNILRIMTNDIKTIIHSDIINNFGFTIDNPLNLQLDLEFDINIIQNLDDHSLNNLTRFLKGNQILITCLKAATYISNDVRSKVLNELLIGVYSC